MNQAWPNAPQNAAIITPEAAWTKRMKTCGTILLVLAGAHVLMCPSRLVMGFLTGPLMRMYFEWLESMSPKVKLSAMLEPMETYFDKIAIWQVAATLPFLGCAIWLGLIGLKILKVDRNALGAARVWTIGAAMAIAISTTIQLVVVVPATEVYSQAIVSTMPHAGSAAMPIDMRQLMGSMTNAATLMGTVMGVIMLGAFPVILYFWTKKLEEDTLA